MTQILLGYKNSLMLPASWEILFSNSGYPSGKKICSPFVKSEKIYEIAMTNKQEKCKFHKCDIQNPSKKNRRHQRAEECGVSLGNTVLLRGPSAKEGIPAFTIGEQKHATRTTLALIPQQWGILHKYTSLWNEHTVSEAPRQQKVPSEISSPAFHHDSPRRSVRLTSSKPALSEQLFVINSRYWCLNTSCAKKQLLFRPNFLKKSL